MRQIPRARLTDPETSRQAATSVRDLLTSQRIILSMLARFGPSTDEEIYEYMAGFHEISVSGARTRRKELVDMGLVRDSGDRGLTRAGRRTIKWEVDDDWAVSADEYGDEDQGREPAGSRVAGDQDRRLRRVQRAGARQRTIRLPR